MAGHSKFKNIMHRKGAQDKKRAKVFSRLGREISVAVKVGGEDIESNIRLRSAIASAEAIADLNLILLSISSPPTLTATDISLPSLENTFALFLS